MNGKGQSLERGSVVGRAVASGQLLGVAGLQSWSLTRYREVSASHCRPTSLCHPSLSLFRFAFVPASVASFLPPLSLHCVENASNTQRGFSSEELIRPIVYSARLEILTLALLDYRPV